MKERDITDSDISCCRRQNFRRRGANNIVTCQSRQRGVTSLFFVLLLSVGLLFLLALAIGSARLYDEHTALQNQANAAAIAAANASQACGSLNGQHYGDISGVVSSLAFPDDVKLGAASSFGYLTTDANKLLVFHPSDDIEQSNAAHVVLTRQSELSRLLPGWLDNNTFTMRAQATAKKEVVGTFQATSQTLNLGGNTNVSLLNALLGAILNKGTPFNLNVADFNSLSSTLVKAGTLLGKIPGVNALTDAKGVQLVNALRMLVPLVPGSSIDVLLHKLKVNAGNIKVSDIISNVGGEKLPPDTEMSVYDLISTMALNIAKDSVYTLNDIGVSTLPGIDVTGTLDVGDPPVLIAQGPARLGSDKYWVTTIRASSDITLQLQLTLDLLKLLGSNALGVVLPNISVHLPLSVDTGGGVAAYRKAFCRKGLSNAVSLYMGSDDSKSDMGVNPTIAKVKTGGGYIKVGIPASLSWITDILGITSDGGITLGLSLDADVDSSGAPSDSSTFKADLNNFQTNEKTFGGGVGGVNIKNLEITTSYDKKSCTGILGCILSPLSKATNALINDIITPVINALAGSNGALSPLLEGLINPLLKGLGVQLGQMQITLLNVQQTPATLVPGKITIVTANDADGT